MKVKNLNPSQIITLNDYPIHNEQVLKLYFRMFHKGRKNIVPPCPVISKNLVLHNFDNKLKDLFKSFKKRNVKAEYFLLDGSHKTTAATLLHKKIRAIILESNKDIQAIKRLVKEGEIISLPIEDTIEEVVKGLKKHFNKTKQFQTIQDKTNRLVKERKVPSYMIQSYKDNKH